eukprot:1737591-Lingulodinium_polyedra.AAC.1
MAECIDKEEDRRARRGEGPGRYLQKEERLRLAVERVAEDIRCQGDGSGGGVGGGGQSAPARHRGYQ